MYTHSCTHLTDFSYLRGPKTFQVKLCAWFCPYLTRVIIADPTFSLFSSFRIWIRSLVEMKEMCLFYHLYVTFKRSHMFSLTLSILNTENLKWREGIISYNYTEFCFIILMFLYNVTKNPLPEQSYKDPIPLVFTAFLGIGLKIRETNLSDSGGDKSERCSKLQFIVGDFRGG